MRTVLCVLGGLFLQLPSMVAAQQLAHAEQKKTYQVAVPAQLPPGLPQGNTLGHTPQIAMNATPCGYLPYADWEVRCHESWDGAYVYEFASAATLGRKIGIPISPRVRRVDIVLAPDLDGYRADVRFTINTNLLSGGRSQPPRF